MHRVNDLFAVIKYGVSYNSGLNIQGNNPLTVSFIFNEPNFSYDDNIDIIYWTEIKLEEDNA